MIHFNSTLTKDSNRNILLLIGIVMLQIATYLYVKPHIVIADDIAYINRALSIFDGSYKFAPSVFSQRFLVFLPASLLYRLFGVNIYSSTAHLLIFAIIHTIIIYLLGNKIRNGLGILAALLFALNPLTLFLTIDLLPDLICDTFILLSIYFLYVAETDTEKSKKGFYGFLFSFFLFSSILAKEYIVLYLPFFLFMCVRSYKINYRFWNSTFLTLVSLVMILGLFYKIQTGSFFYRLSGIEIEHNINANSYYFASAATILHRVLFGSYRLLLGDFSFILLTVLIVPLLINIKYMIKEKALQFWIYNFIFLFIIFQYGSTSLKTYNPIPLEPRWFFILLPAMCILSGYAIQEILNNNSNKWIYIMMITSVISAMVCIGGYHASRINLIFALVVLSSTILILVFNRSRHKVIILLFPLIFIFIYSAKTYKAGTDITKDIYDNYIGQLGNNSIVVMNDLSISAHRYYNFNNTNHLMPINWENIVKDSMSSTLRDKQLYLLIDYNKVKFLHELYKTYIPEFVDNMPSNWKAIKEYYPSSVFQKENIKTLGLYKINSLEELRNNY
jgi:hypothetical protein